MLTDPCFTFRGFQSAQNRLDRLGLSFDDIGRIFVTHPHSDHRLHMPRDAIRRRFPHFDPRDTAMPGISAVSCPGHSRRLHALVFCAASGEVWITGDAVLDEEWLRAWGFYWPNGYSPEEIIQTWQSVAMIIKNADVIVPGHGEPFRVTADLVAHLLAGFPHATYADACEYEVSDLLRERLNEL